MKVFDLQCEHGHSFEGWFGSEDDYRAQTERGLLECPLCASKSVQRRPSAPRLNLSGARAEEPARAACGSREDKPAAARPAAPAQPLPQAPTATASADPSLQMARAAQALWLQAVRQVMANTEDVGSSFAEEARRIHYGEAENRGIRGQTSPEEVEALGDEGIEVYTLPIPEALKGSVQ